MKHNVYTRPVSAGWSPRDERDAAGFRIRPVMESHRLLIQPARMADIAALLATLEDWSVAQWLLLPYPIATTDIARLVAASGNRAGHSDDILLCVRDKETDEVAGGIIVNKIAGPCPLIRYWLRAASWGRGLATEAIGTVMAHVFADGNVRAIRASTDPENVRSLRVLRRLGFRPVEFRRREKTNHRGAPLVLVCECVASEFTQVMGVSG